jgi:catechol 2,3-dioxygenase-like lactoylglutathione lyase family enzyme
MTADLYLDHVLIAVRSLAAAADAYAGLGFTVTPEGRHPGRGTHNRLMVFGPEYLELIAVRNPAATPFRPSMARFLTNREGLYMFALGTADLSGTLAELGSCGFAVGNPVHGRRGADGERGYSWRSADLGRALPGSECFLIQHDQPVSDRYRRPPSPTAHANSVRGVSHLVLAVRDAAAAAAAWGRLPGATEAGPDGRYRRRVRLGNVHLDLASPDGPGELADFLDRHGEGPFELGLKTPDLAASLAAFGSAATVENDGRAARVDPAATAGVRLRLVQA